MSCSSPGWGTARLWAFLEGYKHSHHASQATALPGLLSSSLTSGSRCGRQQYHGSSKQQPVKWARWGSPVGRPHLADLLPWSAAQPIGVSFAHYLDGPGAAGRQIASSTNKLHLVEETVERQRDQRTRGAPAGPGSEPCLLQLLAAMRQIRLCASLVCLILWN